MSRQTISKNIPTYTILKNTDIRTGISFTWPIIVVLRHLFVGSILSIGVIVAFYFCPVHPKKSYENGKRANADTI